MRGFSIFFLNVLLIGLVSYQQTLAQVKAKTPPSDENDVVRVKTELVQTEVSLCECRDIVLWCRLVELSYNSELSFVLVDSIQHAANK